MKLSFAEWLDVEILKSGLTKRELAKRAGLSDAIVYQVTTDDRRPTGDFCVKIAYALGLPTTDVLKHAGFPVIVGAPGSTADAWEAEAWALCQRIPEHKRAVVMEALRAWAE